MTNNNNEPTNGEKFIQLAQLMLSQADEMKAAGLDWNPTMRAAIEAAMLDPKRLATHLTMATIYLGINPHLFPNFAATTATFARMVEALANPEPEFPAVMGKMGNA